MDDLAQYSPNMAGILHHFSGAELYLNEPVFQDYLGIVRDEYDKSFEERNLTVLVKAGFYRTDEVGLREKVSKTTHDLNISRKDDLLVVDVTEPVPLEISKNASQFNGLTLRTKTDSTPTSTALNQHAWHNEKSKKPKNANNTNLIESPVHDKEHDSIIMVETGNGVKIKSP